MQAFLVSGRCTTKFFLTTNLVPRRLRPHPCTPPIPRTPSTALPFHPSHPPHPSVRPFTSSLERCACKTIDSCVFILIEARLAQSVERKALNLVVVGSSPTVGDPCCRVCSLRPRRSLRRAPFAASLVSAVCDGPLRRVSAGTLPLNYKGSEGGSCVQWLMTVR